MGRGGVYSRHAYFIRYVALSDGLVVVKTISLPLRSTYLYVLASDSRIIKLRLGN